MGTKNPFNQPKEAATSKTCQLQIPTVFQRKQWLLNVCRGGASLSSLPCRCFLLYAESCVSMAAMETETSFPSLSHWDCINWILSYLNSFGYPVKYLNIRQWSREDVHTCGPPQSYYSLLFQVFISCVIIIIIMNWFLNHTAKPIKY